MTTLKLFLLCVAISSVCGNLLQPIATSAPNPALFPEIDHPASPVYFADELRSSPIPTNKFWGNFVIGTGLNPVHLHPYVVRVNPGYPSGLSVCHTDEKVFGGGSPDRVQYYFNVFLNNMIFSATEFGEMSREVTSFDDFSVTMKMSTGSSSLTFPLVRGMAYVTAEYENLTPSLHTDHAVMTINGQSPEGFSQSANKFKLTMNNGQTWIIYSVGQSILFTYDAGRLLASTQYNGILRIAQLVDPSQEALLDRYINTYPVSGKLTAATVSPVPSYSFQFETKGNDTLLHYAFPHHQQSLDSSVTPTDLYMVSTTKGDLRAYLGSEWTLNEPKLTNITWLPPNQPDSDKVADIISALKNDVLADFDQETDLDSNYFSGKGLYKFALVCLVADDLGQTEEKELCLTKLKRSFEIFVSNNQQNTLAYDSTWSGIVAKDGLGSDPIADFGNSYYNDHHFHWGYFVQAASVLYYLDSSWGAAHEDWITTLIRDVSNPSSQDPYFPVFRQFDWFSGHSFSQGLFESADGKDQESTSEEVHFLYGVKLWGIVTGNDQLRDLGDLMLSIAIRAINNYFLMDDQNKNHPAEFIGNKVTGIYFENKCDYATWFGANPEFIHGIQMIPMTSISEEVRPVHFVQEEWDQILSNVAPNLQSGWRSILYTNYALINKSTAYQELLTAALDDGLTRTWALYFAATR